jgi:hypothetical protein
MNYPRGRIIQGWIIFGGELSLGKIIQGQIILGGELSGGKLSGGKLSGDELSCNLELCRLCYLRTEVWGAHSAWVMWDSLRPELCVAHSALSYVRITQPWVMWGLSQPWGMWGLLLSYEMFYQASLILWVVWGCSALGYVRFSQASVSYVAGALSALSCIELSFPTDVVVIMMARNQ